MPIRPNSMQYSHRGECSLTSTGHMHACIVAVVMSIHELEWLIEGRKAAP